MIRTEDIIAATAEHYGLSVSLIHAGSRKREHARPRHVALAVTRQLTSLSYPQIGRMFGYPEHTTVLYAVRMVAKRVVSDPKTEAAVAAIIRAAQRRAECRRHRPILALATALARLSVAKPVPIKPVVPRVRYFIPMAYVPVDKFLACDENTTSL